MMKETAINNVGYNVTTSGDYSEKAIQCCIDSWNRLCPEYSLKDMKKTTTAKRWVFCGSNAVTLKKEGVCDQISKVIFGVNKKLTAKAFREHKDPSLVSVNCWIWWNCEEKFVRGWPEHILVDINKGSVVKFPDISPAISHFRLEPVPE